MLLLLLPTDTLPKARVELLNCKFAATGFDDPAWILAPHPPSARQPAKTSITGPKCGRINIRRS
jgi:hypothetical protein